MMERIVIPQWKLKGGKYVYKGDLTFKIIALSVGILLLFLGFLILFYGFKNKTSFSFNGDEIAGIITCLLLFSIGWMLFSSANKKDKFIDIDNQTLNIKSGKNFQSIPFSNIVALVGTQKYINNHYHGVFFSYVLKNQREPVRGQQDLCNAIRDEKIQKEFVTNMSFALKLNT
jgi:hypothetical protein